MSRHIALIIDDEPDILELLKITLTRMDIDCDTALDLQTAKKLLLKKEFNICLTDMKLPDGDGLDFVKFAQEKKPGLPVAIITAHGSMDTAIQALKIGAFDFLTKPVDLQKLRQLIDNALQDIPKTNEANNYLIGECNSIINLRDMIHKLARSQAPVYICGESGVGKELVARMIHEQGSRSEADFVPVNCGAIPHDLMESEFFGHVKGSFTGAVTDRMGLFQAADGGTLFLDEIAELPQQMQVKLLRAIQEKSVRQIGSQKETYVDVRILSATHKDLTSLVANGKFRQDLYYRINVIDLKVPPLRERKSDIPLLVNHILQKSDAALNGEKSSLISEDAMNALMQYSFPGNIRELENILQRVIALHEGKEISIDDLQLPAQEDENKTNTDNDKALDSYLAIQEKERILQALEKTRWNKTSAAKLLGISLRALRYRLEKLGIN